MTRLHTFSCFLIGNQTRLIQCGEILLDLGHRIVGVISSDPVIQPWCREKNLQLNPQDEFIVDVLRREDFDYLFSIDNFQLLPKEVLSIPRKMGVNFHDGPLPRYAGSNATNWALINGETEHGVTWHVLTEKADAGDILSQRIFPVSRGETAFSLNAKCFEASIQSFAELVEGLAEGRVVSRAQDIARRTFCPLWKRPHAAALILWDQSAEDIHNLHRGLDFGNYPNPLGLPKLYLGDNVVVVKKIGLSSSRSKTQPGTVLKVTEDALYVATKTNDLSLGELFTLDGERISPRSLLGSPGVKEGKTLPKIDKGLEDRIGKVHSLLSRYEAFWSKRLAGLEPLEIPYAKRRSLGESPVYRDSVQLLPSVNINGIDARGLPGDIILSVLMLYLWRIGGKAGFDVGFGDKSLQKLVDGCEAFFPSFVPLRADIEPEMNFGDFHNSLKQQIAAATVHHTYARDLKLRHANLRELSRHKVSAELPVVVLRVEKLSDAGKEPLNAEVSITIPDDGRECRWVFDEKVLDETAVRRMQDQLSTLLLDAAAHGERPVGELSVIPDAEKRKILIEWNSTQVDYPRDLCLTDLFEAQVEKTPQAPALTFGTGHLTYRSFNDRANQLAHYLRRFGVGVESLVGVFMERSFEMVLSLYATQKAGGAYVPLDPEYPRERISYMLEDAKVPVILTQKHLVTHIPENPAKVICVDADWPDIARESIDNPRSGVRPENAAYVIFTSGSTGRPKGVLNEHGGIVNRLLWMQDEYGLTPQDSVLQKTTFSFDVSVWEFFWPLLVGSRLVVAKPGGHRDSGYLVKTINDENITTIHFVPSMLQLFLEDKDVGSCRSLKRVICSGEALPFDLQERFFESLDTELHNLYGPTEAAVDVTYWPCRRQSELRTVPIGRPVANTTIYILDPRMQPVPIGVPGELHIGGVQVARGYVNRPDLTAEKFISDPFSRDPGARLYKTGDLCKFLPDGNVEYLGRLDFQVKIRGLRIEIGEIESVLSQHSSIREAVVVAREDTPGDKRLVAYFVSKLPSKINVDELRNFLKGKLADYMVPSAFVQMESFPLTSSGKTDRKALPQPERKRQTGIDYIAPKGDIESSIASVWQETLQIDRVGVNDNFFDLGGHSLLLVKVMNRLKDLFGREISIVDMFLHPTVHELTRFIGEPGAQAVKHEDIDNRARKQKERLARMKRRGATEPPR